MRRVRDAVVACSLASALFMHAANAEDLQPVEVVEVTPPLCNRFADSNQAACINVAEITVRIPDSAFDPGLVRCVLYSEEQQILGTGEAFLRPPSGKLWAVLRPRYRFDKTTLHTQTLCTIQPPYGTAD